MSIDFGNIKDWDDDMDITEDLDDLEEAKEEIEEARRELDRECAKMQAEQAIQTQKLRAEIQRMRDQAQRMRIKPNAQEVGPIFLSALGDMWGSSQSITSTSTCSTDGGSQRSTMEVNNDGTVTYTVKVARRGGKPETRTFRMRDGKVIKSETDMPRQYGVPPTPTEPPKPEPTFLEKAARVWKYLFPKETKDAGKKEERPEADKGSADPGEVHSEKA